MNALRRAALVLALLVLLPGVAQAYLDPGTGSMLLSAIVSVAVTLGMAVQMYWHRLLALLGRGEPEPGAADEPGTRDAGERE